MYGRTRQTIDDNVIWHMLITSWITKVKDTHSEYVIHIAFTRKQWLHEKRLSVTIIRTFPSLLFFDFLLLSILFGAFRLNFKF